MLTVKLGLLKDKNEYWEVRKDAAQALGWMGYKKGRFIGPSGEDINSALLEVVSNETEDWEIRVMSEVALDRIEGVMFGSRGLVKPIIKGKQAGGVTAIKVSEISIRKPKLPYP